MDIDAAASLPYYPNLWYGTSGTTTPSSLPSSLSFSAHSAPPPPPPPPLQPLPLCGRGAPSPTRCEVDLQRAPSTAPVYRCAPTPSRMPTRPGAEIRIALPRALLLPHADPHTHTPDSPTLPRGFVRRAFRRTIMYLKLTRFEWQVEEDFAEVSIMGFRERPPPPVRFSQHRQTKCRPVGSSTPRVV